MLKAFKMGTSKIKAAPTISKFTYCNLFFKIGSQKSFCCYSQKQM